MLISMRRAAIVLLPLAATLLASADDKPLTVDQIVAKNTEARGGLDKIKAIQSMRMTGNIDISGQMQAPIDSEHPASEHVADGIRRKRAVAGPGNRRLGGMDDQSVHGRG